MELVNKKNIEEKNTIFIASDHAGYELKEQIVKYLATQNYCVDDLGCFDINSVDYPDYAIEVAKSVKDNIETAKGILICGTGSGMAITANKVKDIRAVNCFTSEMATMAVEHNNANIICIGARIISPYNALDIIQTFLDSKFEGGRHQVRIDKIHNLTGR